MRYKDSYLDVFRVAGLPCASMTEKIAAPLTGKKFETLASLGIWELFSCQNMSFRSESTGPFGQHLGTKLLIVPAIEPGWMAGMIDVHAATW